MRWAGLAGGCAGWGACMHPRLPVAVGVLPTPSPTHTLPQAHPPPKHSPRTYPLSLPPPNPPPTAPAPGQEAEVIFAPYSYLIDPVIRRAMTVGACGSSAARMGPGRAACR